MVPRRWLSTPPNCRGSLWYSALTLLFSSSSWVTQSKTESHTYLVTPMFNPPAQYVDYPCCRTLSRVPLTTAGKALAGSQSSMWSSSDYKPQAVRSADSLCIVDRCSVRFRRKKNINDREFGLPHSRALCDQSRAKNSRSHRSAAKDWAILYRILRQSLFFAESRSTKLV